MGSNGKGSSGSNSGSNNGSNNGSGPGDNVLTFPIGKVEHDPEVAARRRILYRKPKGDIDVVIHQEELALERQLARRASDALRKLKTHREALLWRFLEYGEVEPGPHSMDAILVHTEPKVTKGSTYYRLHIK